MEIYEEILAHYLSKENAQIIFPQLKLDGNKLAEQVCFQTLEKIRQILYYYFKQCKLCAASFNIVLLVRVNREQQGDRRGYAESCWDTGVARSSCRQPCRHREFLVNPLSWHFS